MTQPSEIEVLVARWREGSEEAARELYEQLAPYILHVVRRRMDKKLRNRFDSHDFTQAVWGSFFTSPPAEAVIPDRAALLHYLSAMARHKVLSAARKRVLHRNPDIEREHSLDGSAAHVLDTNPAPAPTPSQMVAAEDEFERMLARAPGTLRVVLIRLREGKTHHEIAAELGLHPKTICRFLKRLQPVGQEP